MRVSIIVILMAFLVCLAQPVNAKLFHKDTQKLEESETRLVDKVELEPVLRIEEGRETERLAREPRERRLNLIEKIKLRIKTRRELTRQMKEIRVMDDRKPKLRERIRDRRDRERECR